MTFLLLSSFFSESHGNPTSLRLSLSVSPFYVCVALQCDSDSVVKLSEVQVRSVVLTPVSEVSCADVAVSSPPSQHSDSLQDAAGPSETGTEQDSLAKEAPREKDPRRSKHHLHCPVCKVTVNSVTQLEAHNSGTGFVYPNNQKQCLAM